MALRTQYNRHFPIGTAQTQLTTKFNADNGVEIRIPPLDRQWKRKTHHPLVIASSVAERNDIPLLTYPLLAFMGTSPH